MKVPLAALLFSGRVDEQTHKVDQVLNKHRPKPGHSNTTDGGKQKRGVLTSNLYMDTSAHQPWSMMYGGMHNVTEFDILWGISGWLFLLGK